MRFRRLIPIALVTSLLCLPTPWAQAHAELVSSNPAAGAHLDALPTKVQVTFDGNLLTIGGAKTNVLMVRDPQGHQIDGMNSQVSGATLSVDVSPVVTIGQFEVSWRVVSGDGHPEEGSYTFSVGQKVVSETPSPSMSSSPMRSTTSEGFWDRYGTALLLVLVGAVAIGIWARFERARRRSGPRNS